MKITEVWRSGPQECSSKSGPIGGYLLRVLEILPCEGIPVCALSRRHAQSVPVFASGAAFCFRDLR